MFSHIMLGANDMDESKKFYDALFTAIGGKPGRVDAKNRCLYIKDGSLFMLTKPINGEAACNGNGSTIGFTVESPEQGDAWHAAGVANGGIAIEDPPGIRKRDTGDIYLAYLSDPAGNKLCALHRITAQSAED